MGRNLTLVIEPPKAEDKRWECPLCDHQLDAKPEPDPDFEPTTDRVKCYRCDEVSDKDRWDEGDYICLSADDAVIYEDGVMYFEPYEVRRASTVTMHHCPECDEWMEEEPEEYGTDADFQCPGCEAPTEAADWIERDGPEQRSLKTEYYGHPVDEDWTTVPMSDIATVEVKVEATKGTLSPSFINDQGLVVPEEYAVIVGKAVGQDFKSLWGGSDFVYPSTVGAYVEEPTFEATATCGNGLHGLPFGYGAQSYLQRDRCKFLAIGVDKRDGYVSVGTDKVKFRRGKVLAIFDTAGELKAYLDRFVGEPAHTVRYPFDSWLRVVGRTTATLAGQKHGVYQDDVPVEYRADAGRFPGTPVDTANQPN